MYIQLEQEDYDLIAELIADADDGYGCEIEYSDLCIKVTFDKDVEKHQDTDYYKGTGEWITDSVDFALGEVTCDGVEIRCNERVFEKTIKDYLWRI